MNTPTPDVTVRRAYQVYVYAVCFVTVLVMLFAATGSVYALVRIAIPGLTTDGLSTGTRHAGSVELVRNLILGAVAFAVFAFHWRRGVEIRADLDRALERINATPAPAPEPAIDEPAPTTPRRRTPRAPG